jgi:predicted Zn-dependent protease with MMP-like domain
MDWMNAEAPSLEDVESLSRVCFAELPSEFRELAGNITFMVQDFPDDSVVGDMELETPFEILGLFHGPDLASQDQGHGAEPTMIFLYRRPILDYWAETQTASARSFAMCSFMKSGITSGCLTTPWRP